MAWRAVASIALPNFEARRVEVEVAGVLAVDTRGAGVDATPAYEGGTGGMVAPVD